jgi:uncharacterized protein (TIGR03086 family)
MDQLETLQRTIDQTGRIVSGVKPDQFGQPTPCSEWDVRGLLNHTVGGLRMFDMAARGQTIDPASFGQDLLGDDPTAAYDRAAADLQEAFAAPGVLEQIHRLPFGDMPGAFVLGIATVEAFQHGWDLARATGQQVEFDPEVSEAVMAVAQMMPADQVRQPNVFGPEAACPAGAPLHDRVAAFLGRSV